MPLSASGSARSERHGRVTRALPALTEALLTVASIALLLPSFAQLADIGSGRDRRFADAGFRVQGLPDPILPAVCAAHAALAEPAVQARLCGSAGHAVAAAEPVTRPPAVLSDALARIRQAFFEPVRKAEALSNELALQQREGIGELRALSDAIAALAADTQPYVARFQLAPSAETGPAPLVCATSLVESALAADAAGAPTARANAVLLLAAALDGHAATAPLAQAAQLPPTRSLSPACGGQGLATALGAAATLMTDARQSLLSARKNEAMRELLRSAGWHWAGWMLLGLALLACSRTTLSAALGAGLALALWALVAWASRVPWPFAGRAFEPARLDVPPWSPPADFVLVFAGLAALLLLASALRRRGTRFAPQTLSSRLGYPGLVLATGLGWLLLLELSANGHAGNRYLALYHQGHLWLGMASLSVLLFLRQPLARALAWTLSMTSEMTRRARQRLGVWRMAAALALATLAAVAVLGLALSNLRQLTSELGRVWLIVGAAWFFFQRGGPLAERLSRSTGGLVSALRYVGPMLFVVAVLIAAMAVTRDMGPLLIAGYASGAFLAASVAMWWHQRSGSRFGALALAVGLFALWIAITTLALFKLGAIDRVTAARLESLAAPLASTNDQLALVAWFQRAAPDAGFGIGAVPWCGHAPAGSCGGVPAQIHSDYSFTAIVGLFGHAIAWLASIACALWLHRLIRHHGRVTSGEPRFVQAGGRVGHDAQAFVSWIAVAWVVLTLCQLAVTVAGNLAVLPLTGVTFPFVSFGMTSLVVNMAFLALCLSVDLPAGGRHA